MCTASTSHPMGACVRLAPLTRACACGTCAAAPPCARWAPTATPSPALPSTPAMAASWRPPATTGSCGCGMWGAGSASRRFSRCEVHEECAGAALAGGVVVVPPVAVYAWLALLLRSSLSQPLPTLHQDGTPPVSNVIFSPNDAFLLCSTLDSYLRLWDYQPGSTGSGA